MKKANLLLITFDQWRGDWANIYQPIIELPSIKRIGKKGWTAQRCYTSSPQCVPARLSMLSGLMPSKFGVTKNKDLTIPDDMPSMFREMQKNGWETSLVGKTHWSNHNVEHDLRDNIKLLKSVGFNQVVEIAGPRALQRVSCELTDEWKEVGVYENQIKDLQKRYANGRNKSAWTIRHTVLPSNLYPDIWVTERAIKEMDKLNTDKPWILWVSYVGPHEPFDTPKPWSGMNENTKFRNKPTSAHWINELKVECGIRKNHNSWKGKITQREIGGIRKDYADHCRLLDDQVGKLVDRIKTRDDYAKTAVLITADHGELLGDGNMLYKSTFLEGSVRVPLIYKPPKNHEKIRGRATKKPISMHKAIQSVLSSLENGGKLDQVVTKATNNDFVVSEYDEEIMIVKGYTKIVFDADGIPLWGTNTLRDPQEDVNILKSNSRFKSNILDDLESIKEIGGAALAARRDEGWIWRQL